MIVKVWSDLPSFREVEFQSGMNVVLADRGEDSDDNESTNGLGKTTLLKIIQFCLGAELSRDRVLRHSDLNNIIFGLDFRLGDDGYSIKRNTGNPDVVWISTELVAGWHEAIVEESQGLALVTVQTYRQILTQRLVGGGGARSDVGPSFRDLSHYFIRIGKDAFVDPQTAFRNQSGASKRSAMTYMLGLNWPVQQELDELKKARVTVHQALIALADVARSADDVSIGDLEAERVVLEKQLRDREIEVQNFNLRTDYHDLERRLSEVDKHLHLLINENHSDRRLLNYYQESAKSTPPVDANKPVKILQEAGAIFKPESLRTLEEVATFHKRLYQNRSDFLADEIKRLKWRIARRDDAIDEQTSEKSSVLRVLSSSGALDSLVALQRNVVDISSALESLKARIDERKRFDRRKDELTAEIAAKRVLLKRDLDDRRHAVDEAIALFAEYTAFLYGAPGKLSIDVKDSGYRFNISIERQGSDGIDQMVVFCFDLMIATLRARNGWKFLSLIHDSTLFADVDPRQYGLALQLAAHTSTQEGFQYICCLNTGALPHNQLGDLELESVLRLRLTDDNEAGRLLGRRLAPQDLA